MILVQQLWPNRFGMPWKGMCGVLQGGRLPLHFPSGCEDATWHEVAARNLLAGRAESPIVGEDSILVGSVSTPKALGLIFCQLKSKRVRPVVVRLRCGKIVESVTVEAAMNRRLSFRRFSNGTSMLIVLLTIS